MLNIAIIISVNEYIHENPLPACQADAALIRKIIAGADKFDHILELSGNASSSKQQLSEFILHHKAAAINEVFFYYTGHGTIVNDDFCYMFADYDEKKHASTSLSNNELDDMLRSLKPEMVIKVVDGCYSGVRYVKESSTDLFEKSITRSKATFQKCYFMFSSQSHEVSYQDNDYSDFTRAFGEAIFQHKPESIRYRDIIDGIADYFSHCGDQKPTFVVQADNTELFFQITSELRDELTKLLVRPAAVTIQIKADFSHKTEIKPSEPTTVTPTLASRLKVQAQSFCTEEMAHETFAAIRQSLSQWAITPILAELFTATLEYSGSMHDQIPSRSVIGKWVSEHPEVFASVQYENEKYEAEEKVLHPWSFFEYQLKTVTRTRKVISDFENTAESEFYCIECKFVPELINLRHWRGFIVLLCSKSTLYIFSSLTELRDLNWRKQMDAKSAKWAIVELKLSNRDAVVSKINEILRGFETSIVHKLEQAVG